MTFTFKCGEFCSLLLFWGKVGEDADAGLNPPTCSHCPQGHDLQFEETCL